MIFWIMVSGGTIFLLLLVLLFCVAYGEANREKQYLDLDEYMDP